MYYGVSVYMTKDKVNQPCSCGSGLEQDACCGTSNIVEMNQDIYNQDLNDLHKNLVAFAFSNYQDLLLAEADMPDYSPSEENKSEQIYLNGITLWVILNVPVFEGVKTIFDLFFQQHKAQIKRTRTKNIFKAWGNSSPSVYEVISLDDNKEQMAVLKDMITGQEFFTPVKEHLFSIGSAIIGTLVPYVGYHHFFLSMIEVYEHGKEKVVELYEDLLIEEENLTTCFPQFLSTVLELEQKFDWNNANEQKVITLFSEHLDKKNVPEDVKILATLMWYEYCKKRQPTIRNIAAQAAALEYFFHIYIMQDETVTQKQLADEYNTSTGAISANYRKIVTSLEEDILSEESSELDENDATQVDLDDQTDSLPESVSRSKAQDLLYEAEMAHNVKRQNLIKEALLIHPNSPDAYLLLADDAFDDNQFERLVLQAIQAGEKDLGKAFLLKNRGLFWEIEETRPYMRAKEIYANYLFEIGETEQALTHAEDLLLLNPRDNQEIRYLLLPIYLELGKIKKAQSLLDAYEEQSTNFLFNKIIVAFLSDGITLMVRRYIKEANQHNPYVKDYLKGIREIPDSELLDLEYGEEFEAIEYADLCIDLWHMYPELLKRL